MDTKTKWSLKATPFHILLYTHADAHTTTASTQGKWRLAQPRIHGWCHDSLVNAKEKEEEKDKAAESEDWMIQQRLHERHLQQHKLDPMWNMGNGLWLQKVTQLSISRSSLCTSQESCLPHSLSLDLTEHFLIIMTIIINDPGPLSTENKYMYDVLRAWDPLNELFWELHPWQELLG